MDSISKERQLVTRVARVASVVMFLIFLIALVLLLFYVFVLTRVGLSDTYPLSWWVVQIGYGAMTCLSQLYLWLFLRHFARDDEPFSSRQTTRLLSAGVCLTAKAFLSGFNKPFEELIIYECPPPIGPVGIVYDGYNPGTLGIAIFVFCVALLVRYGNALKEDSDSIL